jgi:hypothetical protein
MENMLINLADDDTVQGSGDSELQSKLCFYCTRTFCDLLGNNHHKSQCAPMLL